MKNPLDCGVYRITNTATGKVYIGSSATVSRRIYLHKWDLERGKHHSPLMQRAWSKYGSAAFTFEKVLVCAEQDLLLYEQILIDFYQAADPAFGMNIVPLAGRMCIEWTPERRAASSAARIGKPVFKDDPEKYARLLANVKRGPEHGMFGRKHSPESIAKFSASLKGRTPWNKGISAGKGEKRSEHGRANIAAGTRAGANAKLSMEKAREIRARHAAGGVSQVALAREYGVATTGICKVLANKSWVEG
jgi:group I intron endonuclease